MKPEADLNPNPYTCCTLALLGPQHCSRVRLGLQGVQQEEFFLTQRIKKVGSAHKKKINIERKVFLRDMTLRPRADKKGWAAIVQSLTPLPIILPL